MATQTKKKTAPKKKASTKKPAKKRSTKKSAKKTVKKTSSKKSLQKKLNIKAIIAIALCLCLIGGCFWGAFIVRNNKNTNVNREKIAKIIDKDTAWGIDVSNHNGKIDWEKVSKKADFAFIRVGYRGYAKGEFNPDKQFKNNIKGAEKYGVPYGVYFYSQATNEKEAEEEADYILEKIKEYDVKLPVVIDFEYAVRNGKRVGRLAKAKLNNKKRTAILNAFCNKVREAGYSPGIYASSYIFRSRLNMSNIEKDIFIWVADYNKSVGYNGKYDIWQYSEKGKCSGVKNKVDTNYWYIKSRL